MVWELNARTITIWPLLAQFQTGLYGARDRQLICNFARFRASEFRLFAPDRKHCWAGLGWAGHHSPHSPHCYSIMLREGTECEGAEGSVLCPFLAMLVALSNRF